MNSKYQRIKPHFNIIAHSPNSLELRSGVWNRISYTVDDETESGKLYQFISLLDGSRSISDIVKQTGISRSEAEGVIDHLTQLNVIEDSHSTAFDYYTDIYAPAFKSKQLTVDEINNKKIFILSDEILGEQIKNKLIETTTLSNVEIIQKQSEYMKLLTDHNEGRLHEALKFEEVIQNFIHLKDSFAILAFDYINPAITKRFNRIAQALNITWIHAAIDGPFIFVGPTFEKHQTACYECFETRVAINLREYGSYQNYKKAIVNNQIVRQAEFPMQNLLRNLLISHLTLEVLNHVLTGCNFTKNKVMAIYLPTMEITFNEFLKISNCDACGSQVHRDDHQLYFDVQGLLQGAI